METLPAGGRKYCPHCPAMETTTSCGSDRNIVLSGSATRGSMETGCQTRPARMRKTGEEEELGRPSFLPSLLPTRGWGCCQLQDPARRQHCCQAFCMGQEGAGRWHPDILCESPVGPGRGKGLLEQSRGSSGSLYIASLSLCCLDGKSLSDPLPGHSKGWLLLCPGLEVQFYPRQGKQAEPGLFARSA